MAKHKWYNEIIAWASGEQIQYRKIGSEKWRDEPDELPCWDSIVFEYRIKPQPKEPEYVHAWLDKKELSVSFYYDEPGILEDDDFKYLGKIKLEV